MRYAIIRLLSVRNLLIRPGSAAFPFTIAGSMLMALFSKGSQGSKRADPGSVGAPSGANAGVLPVPALKIQPRLARLGRRVDAEVLVGVVGRLAAAGGAREEADLQQVGFHDLDQGRCLLAQGGAQRLDADRAALVD